MTATTFIRTACRKKLEALVKAELAGIDVDLYRNEPRELPANYIAMGPSRGTVDYPAMAPSLPRSDIFETTFYCRCREPGDDVEDAEERVEQYANAVMTAMSQNPQNEDPPGWPSGVIDVTVTESVGPITAPADDGHAAFWSVTVEVHTRIVRET